MSDVPPKDQTPEGQGDIDKSAPSIAAIPANTQQQDSPNLTVVEKPYKEKPKEKWLELDLQDRLMVLLTTGVLVVAALTAYIFLKQADIMQGQLEEMKGSGEQTERLIILNQGQLVQTSRQVGKLGEQVAQLQRSANETHNLVSNGRTAIADERISTVKERRPYVSVSLLAPPVFIEGAKANWNFYFSNFGRSPAVRTSIRSQVVFGPNDVTKINKIVFQTIHEQGSKDAGMIIPPGDGTGFSTAFSNEILSKPDVDYINATDGGVALLIHFEYFDLDGNMYSTELCKFRLATGAIANCDIHNVIR
jgi:hypothetical protein